MCHELQDPALLAKLSAGDMIAIEAKYHLSCLNLLYSRARQSSKTETDESHAPHDIAFAELIMFMEDMKDNDGPVFQLSTLAKLYKQNMEQLGVVTENRIHTTRLKDRLLSQLPTLRAYPHGREFFLTFEDDVVPALTKACTCDKESVYLARAANVVRKEIFNDSFTFEGSFQAGCQ